MTKKIFEIEECEVAGENPATPPNEVTPIVAGGTVNSQLGGLVA